MNSMPENISGYGDSPVNRGIPLTDAICKRAILSTSFSS